MIALLGHGSLPAERCPRHEAAGARAAQFATAFERAGIAVTMLRVAPAGDGPSVATAAGAVTFPLRELSREEAEDGPRLARLLAELRPRAVVGASTYGSYLLARAAPEVPLWVDLNGDPMAEGLAGAAASGTEGPMLDAWWMLSWCLRRGDRFSAISRRQRWALLGQLGAYGRLAATTGDPGLVAVVPEAIESAAPWASTARDPLILCSGSFNTWTDGPTLASALERALVRREDLRCAITGGPVAGAESAWSAFQVAVEAWPEPAQRRVEWLGWLDSDRLEALEARALCGVVAELPHIERELGGQNRSLRWIARGIAVVTTERSELGEELGARGLALTYLAGNTSSLADALLSAAGEPDRIAARTRDARAWLDRHRSIAATTAPLVEWARKPRPAADRISGAAARSAERQIEMLRDIRHLAGDGD